MHELPHRLIKSYTLKNQMYEKIDAHQLEKITYYDKENSLVLYRLKIYNTNLKNANC